MPLEINYYNLQGHEPMLLDTVRCEAFHRAIFETVVPGCTVLDIGAGTGILSVFAAQAGAAAVYAVERTSIAELAQCIVRDNHAEDRIHVMQNDMEALELPEKVDVIVSEWLGGYGVDENLLPVVVHARDRWLKPGGAMIPETVTSWMAPAYDDLLQQDVDFYNSTPYGIHLNVIGQAIYRQLDCARNHVKQNHLLCDPQLMWTVDSRVCSQEHANRPFTARLAFTAHRKGCFNVLAAWFQANLTHQITLSNGPADPNTHWGRTLLPIGKTISVKQGTCINVHVVLEPQGKGRTKVSWTVDVEDYHFHAEDITVLT